MLTHIVCWKYRAGVTEGQRREHVARLRRLREVVPEVLGLSVGADVLKLQRSYHTGLVATFRDRDALEAYNVHPDHAAVVAFGREISEHVVSVDFEDEEGAA